MQPVALQFESLQESVDCSVHDYLNWPAACSRELTCLWPSNMHLNICNVLCTHMCDHCLDNYIHAAPWLLCAENLQIICAACCVCPDALASIDLYCRGHVCQCPTLSIPD